MANIYGNTQTQKPKKTQVSNSLGYNPSSSSYKPTNTSGSYQDALLQLGSDSSRFNDWDDINSMYLKNQNYVGLLNANTQLGYVRAMMNKNSQAKMASQGYDGMGEGSSLQAQEDNNTANAYATALQNYNNQQMQIDMQQSQNANAEVEKIVQQIGEDPTTYKDTMIREGLMEEDGSPTPKFKSLSVSMQNELTRASQSGGYDQDYGRKSYAVDELGDLIAGENNDKTIAKEHPKEWNTLKTLVNTGTLPDGCGIHLNTGYNKNSDKYLIYRNGRFVEINKEQYDKCNKQAWFDQNKYDTKGW